MGNGVYWQISVGSDGRDYAKDFIRYGMAFVGGDEYVERIRKVRPGDTVVMKRGMSEIVAAGTAVERDGKHGGEGDKDWLRDYDGWDLRGYCFVDWHVPKKPLAVSGLTRTTIQGVGLQHLRDLADDTIANVPVQEDLQPEPDATGETEDSEILKFLIRQGLRPGAADDLTTAFSRIRLLAQSYRNECWPWSDIREHESRTFLVIPLLLALGWAEQQIKIELPAGGGKADIGCFRGPYERNKDDCVLMLETKGFKHGLRYAPKQVKGYAKRFPSCQAVIVTNGYCYKAYERDGNGAFKDEPSAYLNLLRPRDKYPIDPENVEGCLEALRLLLPSTYL